MAETASARLPGTLAVMTDATRDGTNVGYDP